MARENVALTSGTDIGREKKRGSVTTSNYQQLGYISKCPFGYYFVTSNDEKIHNRQVTAQEKYNTYEAYKREVCQLATLFTQLLGKPCKEANTILKNILVAQLELSYYKPTEYIIALGSSSCSSTLERTDIKNKISSFRQRVGLSNNTSNYNNNYTTVVGNPTTGRSFGNMRRNVK